MGIDVAGVVESVGASVTRFKPGDEVFARPVRVRAGRLRRIRRARRRRRSSRSRPGMSFEVAATLPHSAVLALQGLRLRNGRTPEPGDKVLIDGASGNVGPFAVQIAKSMGAEVTGVGSTAKLDFVRSLGADHVIDYTKVDYTRPGERYDWILDTDSHHPILRGPARTSTERRLRHARRDVAADLRGDARRAADLAGQRQVDRPHALVEAVQPGRRGDPDELIAAGKVKPAIDRRFPLSEIVEALAWVDDGHAEGQGHHHGLAGPARSYLPPPGSWTFGRRHSRRMGVS